MSLYLQALAASEPEYQADCNRLELVQTSVGFDDMLDVTLGLNRPHFDTVIIVITHDDKRTQAVARKHKAIIVQTDLFRKNGRKFNKGAAINAGFNHFQYHGLRCHMDADTAVSDTFRHLLTNHTRLDESCIYGADRVNVVGPAEISALLNRLDPQHRLIREHGHRPIYKRYMDPVDDYCPIGYFQLWHARCQKSYPYSLGTAAHDDTMFSAQWPSDRRRLLPTVLVHHLCAKDPTIGENWDGNRRQPRID